MTFAIQIAVDENLDRPDSQRPRLRVIKAAGDFPVAAGVSFEIGIPKSGGQLALPAGSVVTLHGGNIIVTPPGATPPTLNDDGSLDPA